MTMDKSAIQHIQHTAHVPDFIQQIKAANTESPIILVPEGMTTKDLEQYMPNATRYRNAFSTTSIKDFVEYNQKFDQDGAICFIDADRMQANSILDMGTKDAPLHKEHSASLYLKKTAAYDALLEINGREQLQKTAAEFIEDWEDNIIVFDKSGNVMTNARAANALRDMSIETAREVNSKVSDFGESMSAMERIEAKNQDSIPATIEFTCEPYNGLRERPFKLRVGILTGGDRPKIVFRILKLEAIQEEMAEEFKDILVAAFEGDVIETFIGTANNGRR